MRLFGILLDEIEQTWAAPRRREVEAGGLHRCFRAFPGRFGDKECSWSSILGPRPRP
jgi:hypothetical protein